MTAIRKRTCDLCNKGITSGDKYYFISMKKESHEETDGQYEPWKSQFTTVMYGITQSPKNYDVCEKCFPKIDKIFSNPKKGLFS